MTHRDGRAAKADRHSDTLDDDADGLQERRGRWGVRLFGARAARDRASLALRERSSGSSKDGENGELGEHGVRVAERGLKACLTEE